MFVKICFLLSRLVKLCFKEYRLFLIKVQFLNQSCNPNKKIIHSKSAIKFHMDIWTNQGKFFYIKKVRNRCRSDLRCVGKECSAWVLGLSLEWWRQAFKQLYDAWAILLEMQVASNTYSRFLGARAPKRSLECSLQHVDNKKEAHGC